MAIIKRPIITEKTAFLMDKKVPQYGFEVAIDATKAQVKKEIERVYEVQVENVNTMIIRGKSRQRFSKRGVTKGKTPNYKKAIVTLKDGFDIDFYSHI